MVKRVNITAHVFYHNSKSLNLKKNSNNEFSSQFYESTIWARMGWVFFLLVLAGLTYASMVS